MSFTKWHKNQVEKNLNMFGLSTYQGFGYHLSKD